MIGLHIKTSWQYVRRSPFQALAAISILALTFFVTTLIAIVVYGSNQLIADFETRPQVIAFMKKDAADDKVSQLQSKLAKDTRIRDLKFVTKEQAVDIYKDATSDNPLLGELVSPSIFPSSLEFSVTDLSFAQQIIDEVGREDVVDSVGFTASVGGADNLNDVISKLKSITYYIRVGGAGTVGVLGITSFLVLMVVISMRIQSRKSEIDTLSLIGATKSFIRTPIIFEALNYAVIGVILGWILGLVVILYATPTLLAYFDQVPVIPRDSGQFFGLLGIILAFELLAGIIIAFMGSMVSLMRAFK